MLAIGGLTRFTTIDYPGKLAAVLFCQGCPWRCGYCHNRHLLMCGQPGTVPWGDVLRFLEQRHGLLDAVVFSGGEPTMQHGLRSALAEVRHMGFSTGLHTAGPFPERLHSCLPYLNWVGMDIKASFDEYHLITAVQGSGDAARQSAELLCRNGVPHQFRTTLDPFLLNGGRIETMRQRVREEWGEELIVQPCQVHTRT